MRQIRLALMPCIFLAQTLLCGCSGSTGHGEPSAPAAVLPTGAVIAFMGNQAPEGWVFMDGKTIGNPASKATYHNANTKALYKFLWENSTNELLPVQESEGGISLKRGESAEADFALNKRLPLPDARGRTLVGLEDLVTSASESGRKKNSQHLLKQEGEQILILGSGGGEKNHTLILAELPKHSHVVYDEGHFHKASIRGATSATDSSGASQRGSSYDEKSPDQVDSSTVKAGISIKAAGGGKSHNNMQPWLAVRFIIKL